MSCGCSMAKSKLHRSSSSLTQPWQRTGFGARSKSRGRDRTRGPSCYQLYHGWVPNAELLFNKIDWNTLPFLRFRVIVIYASTPLHVRALYLVSLNSVDQQDDSFVVLLQNELMFLMEVVPRLPMYSWPPWQWFWRSAAKYTNVFNGTCTLFPSMQLASMTMVLTSCSQIMHQKSATVLSRGPWAAMKPRSSPSQRWRKQTFKSDSETTGGIIV